jgi:hypothetical protein
MFRPARDEQGAVADLPGKGSGDEGVSGGTEGALSPHWIVFEVEEERRAQASGEKALAMASLVTPDLPTEQIARSGRTTSAILRSMPTSASSAAAHHRCLLLNRSQRNVNDVGKSKGLLNFLAICPACMRLACKPELSSSRKKSEKPIIYSGLRFF